MHSNMLGLTEKQISSCLGAPVQKSTEGDTEGGPIPTANPAPCASRSSSGARAMWAMSGERAAARDGSVPLGGRALRVKLRRTAAGATPARTATCRERCASSASSKHGTPLLRDAHLRCAPQDEADWTLPPLRASSLVAGAGSPVATASLLERLVEVDWKGKATFP